VPRKRRAVKARLDTLRLDRLEVVDWLLTGALRSPDEAEQLEASGMAYDWFVEFDHDWPPANLAELWRTHRSTLMAEAKKRGISEPWGRRFDNAQA